MHTSTKTLLVLLLPPALLGSACDPQYEPVEHRVAVADPSFATSPQGVGTTPLGVGLVSDNGGSSGGSAGEALPAEESEAGRGIGFDNASASTHPGGLPADDISAEPPEVAGGSPDCGGIGNSTINAFGCHWERAASGSGAEVSVGCPANRWAISGSCTTGSSAVLEAFRPYESGDPSNPIDDGDDLDDADGWWCRYDSGPGANNHVARALCCPTFEVAACN
jgi:hypothetical protein